VSHTGVIKSPAIDVGRKGTSLHHGPGRQLVWNENGYALVWSEAGNIVLARISRTGASVTTSNAVVSSPGNPAQGPAIDRRPAGYGLTWVQGPLAGESSSGLHFSRATDEGLPVPDSAILLSTPGSMDGTSGAVLWDGVGWVASWLELPTHFDASLGDVWKARIDATGALVPGSRLLVNCRSPEAFAPALAASGGEAAVTFIQGSDPGVGHLAVFK
jgi:hypothetical protein